MNDKIGNERINLLSYDFLSVEKKLLSVIKISTFNRISVDRNFIQLTEAYINRNFSLAYRSYQKHKFSIVYSSYQ